MFTDLLKDKDKKTISVEECIAESLRFPRSLRDRLSQNNYATNQELQTQESKPFDESIFEDDTNTLEQDFELYRTELQTQEAKVFGATKKLEDNKFDLSHWVFNITSRNKFRDEALYAITELLRYNIIKMPEKHIESTEFFINKEGYSNLIHYLILIIAHPELTTGEKRISIQYAIRDARLKKMYDLVKKSPILES